MTSAPKQPHRVVIVGAGFGGLEATFGLAGAPVEITLVDRRNHHLFQPLLYQVATASLATSEIAWPIRYLLRDRPDVTTLFANVNGVDAVAKHVLLDDGGTLPYDTLILATLLEPEWKDYEMPLKSILEDPWGLAVKLGEEKFYKFMSDMIVDWHRTGRIVELEKKYGMGNTSFAVKMTEKYKK